MWVHHFFILSHFHHLFRVSGPEDFRNFDDDEEPRNEKFIFYGGRWEDFMYFEGNEEELCWRFGPNDKLDFNKRGYY